MEAGETEEKVPTLVTVTGARGATEPYRASLSPPTGQAQVPVAQPCGFL
jgi:hypothetical protein